MSKQRRDVRKTFIAVVCAGPEPLHNKQSQAWPRPPISTGAASYPLLNPQALENSRQVIARTSNAYVQIKRETYETL
jgi:hypothetical protein